MKAPRSNFHIRFTIMITLALIPALVLAYVMGEQQREVVVADVKDEMLLMARSLSLKHEQHIEEAKSAMLEISSSVNVNLFTEDCSYTLSKFIQDHPDFINMAIVDPKGRILCSAHPYTRVTDLSSQDWFTRAASERRFVTGNIHYSTDNLASILNLAYPITDLNGQVNYVVLGTTDLKWLPEAMSKLDLSSGSALAVVNQQGALMARYPDPDAWVGRYMPDLSHLPQLIVQREGTAELTGIDKVPRLYGFTVLHSPGEDTPAYIAIGEPTHNAYASAERLRTLQIIMLSIVTFLALTLTWVGGNFFFTKRIQRLVEATQRLTKGDLTVRSSLPYTRGELGTLARAFDEMASALQDRISERDLAELALRQERESLRLARRQLSSLTNYLQTVMEEERVYIAREIHDEFGQVLTALKIDLSWIEQRLPKNATSLTQKINGMKELIDSAIQSVRRIATELRPGLLDRLGLAAAIEWQAQEFGRRTGIQTDLNIEDIPVGSQIATAFFRIFQECLTNTSRHSEATSIDVSLYDDGQDYILQVKDNGKGASQERLNENFSFGLLGMRERALGLGGSIHFDTQPGMGMTVTVTIPHTRTETTQK